MGSSNLFLYVVVGVAVVAIGVILLKALRDSRRWEAAVDQVARTFKGTYTKGVTGATAGSVTAKVDGFSFTVEQSTEHIIGSDSERRYMVIKVGTSKSKPEYLGPPRKPNKYAQTTDYSRSGNDTGTLELGGMQLEVDRLGNKLSKSLDDPELQGLLIDLFAADGRIEFGNVVVRSRRIFYDGDKMTEHIRALAVIAAKL